MSSLAFGALPGRRIASLSLAAAFGCVLLGGIAVLDPFMAVGLVLVAGFVFVSFRNLTWGVMLFVVLMFLENVLERVGAEIVIKGAGGVLATAWAAQVLLRRDETRLLARDRPVVTAALLGLLVWAFTSSLWAADSSVATSTALRLSQSILFVFIVYTALAELGHFRRIAAAYIVGAALAAGFGLASLGSSGRLGGDAGNPNEVAAFMLPALILSAFLLLGERGPLLRFSVAATGVLLLAALLMTGSRGGLIALGLALPVAIALAGPRRAHVAAASLVILAGVVVYYATSASPEQVERIGEIRDDGGTGRSDLWAVALEVARDRPVTGAGAGNFPVVEGQYAAGEVSIERIDLVLDQSKVAHNTYLGLLSELGIVGLACFMFLLLAALGSAVQAVQRLRDSPWALQLPVRGLVVGFFAMLVAFSFTSSEHEKQLWLLIGAALTLPALVRDHRRGAGAPRIEKPTFP